MLTARHIFSSSLALGLTLCLTLRLIAASVVTPPATVTLSWTYPGTPTPDLAFVIYYSTNLNAPFTNWPVLTNFYATNQYASSLFTTNMQFGQQVAVVPGQYFFVVVASNMWGISQLSNMAWTPPVPLPFTTQITLNSSAPKTLKKKVNLTSPKLPAH